MNKRIRAILVWPWNENEQTKQKQQTNRKRAIWLVYRTDTKERGFWLVKRTLKWKNFMPENFLEINRYFALTSYCNTTDQSNNASSILGFSLAGKQRVHVLIFSSIDLWNRWRTLTQTIFQGHRKIALTWPLPESTKAMFKQYRIAFAPARKPYRRIGFCSHIRTVLAARFR